MVTLLDDAQQKHYWICQPLFYFLRMSQNRCLYTRNTLPPLSYFFYLVGHSFPGLTHIVTAGSQIGLGLGHADAKIVTGTREA